MDNRLIAIQESESKSGSKKSSLLSLDELKEYYNPERLGNMESMTFFGTLAFNKWNEDWDSYNEVCRYVYLGRIPEKNNYPGGVRLIVSMVSYGELASIDFDYHYLQEKAIRHLFVYMKDFTGSVCKQAVINAVKMMLEYAGPGNFNQDNIVYVHCKAGRSRSAMVVAIYSAVQDILQDMQKGKMSFSDDDINQYLNNAINKITQNRKQVDIGINKFNTAKEILIEMIHQFNNKLDDQVDSAEKLDKAGYLCSLKFKNDLCQFPSFKRLCTYLVMLNATQSRAVKLQDFLNQILYASDKEAANKWYGEMIIGASMLDAFVNCKPQLTEDDRPKREELAQSFKVELSAHLAKKYPKDFYVKLERDATSKNVIAVKLV